MKEKSFLSVVIYTYNQINKLSKSLVKIDKYLLENFENYEIIIVNNGSNDNTEIEIENIKNKLRGHTSLINLNKKQNIETAILAGTELAIGDFVIEIENIDSGFDYSIILDLYKKCTSGFDIVSGASTNCKKDSLFFYHIFNKINILDINLNTEPIRIITRRALNQALRSKEKNRYRKILYLATGFPHDTIYYCSKKTVSSNKTFKEKLNLGLEILLSFSNLGLDFTFLLSFVFFLISVLIGLYTIYIYLTYKQVISGWTTTMLFLSFGFAGMFLITGILVKLLTMVLHETKDKPQYSVKSVKRIN